MSEPLVDPQRGTSLGRFLLRRSVGVGLALSLLAGAACLAAPAAVWQTAPAQAATQQDEPAMPAGGMDY